MKNIYIHIGFNKAASSYFQEILRLNDNLLRKNNFYYPFEKKNLIKEHTLQKGNGIELMRYLRKSEWIKIEKYLIKIYKNAPEGSDSFISNESILPFLIEENNLKRLEDLIFKIGFNNLSYIIFFRNLYHHAISAYCHRAGTGRMNNFENWIYNKEKNNTLYMERYEIWEQLYKLNKNFLVGDRIPNIKSILVGTDLDSQISNLLKIKNLKKPTKKVNISISLDEAILINKIFEYSPLTAKTCRSKCKSLIKASKPKNKMLLLKYSGLIKQHIKNNIVVINAIEKKLNLDSISKETINFSESNKNETNLEFNSMQINTFLEAYKETKPLTLKYLKYQLNYLLLKIKLITKKFFKLI